MENDNAKDNVSLLTDHFFRKEYGRMVAVISKYVGFEVAEDIVQDTLLSAVEYWQHHGVPSRPQAWLYTTAKNKSLNWLRKNRNEREYQNNTQLHSLDFIAFDENVISDEQVRVMLSCCSKLLREETQIVLILKILCGFSVAEIAAAFYTNTETINKRLVRGRKALRENGVELNNPNIENNVDVLLKTIYLLFNEGYSPSRKNQIVRKDLCLEAIQLAEIILKNGKVSNISGTHSLIALMYLNCSRFDARLALQGEVIEMADQNRALWSQELINKGLFHLEKGCQLGSVSIYLILATISANHCIAPNMEQTNWQEILELYNILSELDNSPYVQLNRLVAFSKVYGDQRAVLELLHIKELANNHLYHSTLATLYENMGDLKSAANYYKRAILLAPTSRDRRFLIKKLNTVVPIP